MAKMNKKISAEKEVKVKNKKLVNGKHGMGWRVDKPDFRDKKYPKVGFIKAAQLPSQVDLRPNCPPIYDQGQLGSCVANGTAAGHQFEQMKQGLSDEFIPSRLFIYYFARSIEGTVDQDSGAEIRDGIKAVASQGVCPETMWPYDISQFTVQPPQNCLDVAKGHTAVTYLSIDNTQINQIKQSLADGYPVVFGASLYQSFESDAVASTGMVPMPGKKESVIGGHCQTIVGYIDSIQCFIVRNSWGESWGKNGYCFFPYAYLTNEDLASDFWTIRLVSDNSTPTPAPSAPIVSWWKKIFSWF